MDKMNKASSHRAEGASLKSKNYLILRILFGFPIYFLKNILNKNVLIGNIWIFMCYCNIIKSLAKKMLKCLKHLVNEGTNSIHDPY